MFQCEDDSHTPGPGCEQYGDCLAEGECILSQLMSQGY